MHTHTYIGNRKHLKRSHTLKQQAATERKPIHTHTYRESETPQKEPHSQAAGIDREESYIYTYIHVYTHTHTGNRKRLKRTHTLKQQAATERKPTAQALITRQKQLIITQRFRIMEVTVKGTRHRGSTYHRMMIARGMPKRRVGRLRIYCRVCMYCICVCVYVCVYLSICVCVCIYI